MVPQGAAIDDNRCHVSVEVPSCSFLCYKTRLAYTGPGGPQGGETHVLRVEGFGGSIELVDVAATCGGQAVSCIGLGHCERVYISGASGVGACHLRSGTSGYCADVGPQT